MHKVFVYGTLKQGEPNHSRFSKAKEGHYRFVGPAKTLEKYPLIIGTEFNIPFLLYSPGTGNQVEGEVYEVDDKVFKDLDELEDHPNFYIREKCQFERAGEKFEAWAYFIKNFKNDLLKGPFYTNYSSYGSHGLKYIESENATIEDLK